MNRPLLSIQIPTTPDRALSYDALQQEFLRQCVELGEEPLEGFIGAQDGLKGWRSNNIEFMYYLDNKEISIGEKRDRMYKAATAKYSVQWDSDDMIAKDGVNSMLTALCGEPSCVGYRESAIINGEYFASNISLRYDDWSDGLDSEGFMYRRTPFFKTPILTNICQEVGVADMRYGEDHDFARRVKPLLNREAYLDKEIYFYQHTSTPHNERYGLDKI